MLAFEDQLWFFGHESKHTGGREEIIYRGISKCFQERDELLNKRPERKTGQTPAKEMNSDGCWNAVGPETAVNIFGRKDVKMRTMKKANPFFQKTKKIIKPFWIGMMAGMGFLACVSTTTPPTIIRQALQTAPTAIPAAATHKMIPVAASATSSQGTVFERVEDYGQFPETSGQASGPINVIPPTDPLLAAARIRGVQWPMVNNNGPAQVYPKMKGLVSFYHEDAEVATGEAFNPRALTAAHKSLPFGTIVRCTRTDTGRSVVVMINDRGPYVRGRILDLSRSAARQLDMITDGVVPCLIEVLAYPLIEAMGPKGNG